MRWRALSLAFMRATKPCEVFANEVSEGIGRGDLWLSAVLCGAVPGGPKGRGALAFSVVT
jgi:hypothetical protein